MDSLERLSQVAHYMVDVRKLIRDYSASVAEFINELLALYPSFEMRPLGLTIPRKGTLPSGRTYCFHGIGCRFEKDGVITDMDFGPDGRIDGFDAWRLNLFAEGIPSEDEGSLEAIQVAVDELRAVGAITKSDSSLGSHLYFPTRDGSSQFA